MPATRLVIIGPVGTRWLFGLIVASALGAWASESALGVIDPNDRIAYPFLAASFSLLAGLTWWRPLQLRRWHRWGVMLLAAYFSVGMLAFTLRPDPGPSLYTLASLTPWTLGGCLLLFITWRARHALQISLALLALMLAPPTLRRFAGTPPAWLETAWPLLANLALCQVMFCLALWALSRQFARLTLLVPASDGPATPDALVKARLLELERARADAEAASRAKSDFLANIGHEIRTPMNTVLGQTQLLLAGRLQASQRSQLQEVARAGESLVRLIDGLLDYADLGAGRLQLAAAPLRLELLLENAFDAVRSAAQAKQLELLCDIASPALLAADGTRRGDAARLTQLVTELLVNAVKFTPAGQVKLSAHLEPDGAWRLRVRDSGVGMSADQLARCFMPFAQAEAGAARRFGGTGLGLATCRALAEHMGGSLNARSTPGRGSSFELRLPLPACPELPPPAPSRTAHIVLVKAPHSPGHDELVSQLRALAPSARLELMPQGHAALAWLTTVAAVAPADLLLLDWVLPDMEGSELLRRLSAAGVAGAHRIVLMSAFDTPVLRARALRQGAHALCPKPLLPHTLRRLLDLDQALPSDAEAEPLTEPLAATTDAATLITELDTLLGDADSQALAVWEQYGSDLMELLPAPQAQALAGAMQRFDFDEAQAALRGDRHP